MRNSGNEKVTEHKEDEMKQGKLAAQGYPGLYKYTTTSRTKMSDQFVFLYPHEKLHVMFRTKHGYTIQVFSCRRLGPTEWSELVTSNNANKTIGENEACNLTCEGDPLIEGYRKSIEREKLIDATDQLRDDSNEDE